MSRKLTWKEKMEQQVAAALHDPTSSFFDPSTLADRDDAFKATIAHLRHANDLVRSKAIGALANRFNLQPRNGICVCRYCVLVSLNMAQLPTSLIEGAEGLEAIFRGLARGESHERLGLGHTTGPIEGKLKEIVDIFNASRPYPPLPIEVMKSLEGGDAEWLRAALFARMQLEGQHYYRHKSVSPEELDPVLHTPLTAAERKARGVENLDRVTDISVLKEHLNPARHTPLTAAERKDRDREERYDVIWVWVRQQTIWVRVRSRWIPALIAVKPAGWRTLLDEEQKLKEEQIKQYALLKKSDPDHDDDDWLQENNDRLQELYEEDDWLQELRGFLKELD
jgi:hypothetical protein